MSIWLEFPHKMKLTINPNNEVWQIGTGDDSRNYFNVFLKYGVACIGPGNPGSEMDEKTKEFYCDHPTVRNWGSVLLDVNIGDLIIARKGRKIVKGVGIVKSEYQYSEIFEDIQGWDLQHFVEVDWFVLEDQRELNFDKSLLSGSTLERCSKDEVLSKILVENFNHYISEESSILELSQYPLLKVRDLKMELLNKGLRVIDADFMLNSIERIQTLVQWYYNNDANASEAEIRSFLVIPFFIALGWSEQKMKLEFAHIDISLFDKPFRDGRINEPSLIIEVKKLKDGLAFTNRQIEKYGIKFPKTYKFITTNGHIYNYYEKNEEGELIELGGFNLLKLRTERLIRFKEKYLNTIETISKMLNS